MNQENRHIIDDLEPTRIQLPSDSYFEGLKKSILDQIDHVPVNTGLKKKEPRIISMYKRWYVWGSAAAILVFALLFPWNNNTDPGINSGSVNLSSVSNEEIYDYLSENIEDLDSETIAVHLNDVVINEENTAGNQSQELHENTFVKSNLLEHVKDEEILDYLENESGELDEYLLIES